MGQVLASHLTDMASVPGSPYGLLIPKSDPLSTEPGVSPKHHWMWPKKLNKNASEDLHHICANLLPCRVDHEWMDICGMTRLMNETVNGRTPSSGKE